MLLGLPSISIEVRMQTKSDVCITDDCKGKNQLVQFLVKFGVLGL